MQIKIIEVGMLGTNSYLVFCDKTREGVIIDPGGDAEKIIKVIKDEKVDIQYIINTHGHHDHIGANKELKEYTNKELLISKKDSKMLISPERNISFLRNPENVSPAPDRFIKDGDILEFGTCKLKVIGLPGHTSGGMGLYAEKEGVLFS